MKLIKRLKNIARWLPVLWNDYHWDYVSLYPLLHHKLEEMEYAIRNGVSANREKDAARIHYCVLLLKRLEADEYLTCALEPVERRWGNSEIVIDTTSEGLYVLRGFRYPLAKNETEQEQADMEWRRAARRADDQKEQDWNELWETIRRYGRHWWD